MVRRTHADDLDLPIDPFTFEIGEDRLIPRGFVGSRGFLNTSFQLERALVRYGGYSGESGVYTFEYDWRKSALETARDLDALVESIRQQRGGAQLQVDLITHSAGSLVALSYIHAHPESVRHAVLVAPPLDGTLEAFRVLARGERIIRRTIPPKSAATFASLFELLPSEPFLIDERGGDVRVDWDRFCPNDAAGRAACDALREQAQRVRELRRRPLPPGVQLHVVAGDCIATPRRALLRRDGSLAFYPAELRPGEATLRSRMFEPGDGSITVSSALVLGVPSQLFCDGHHGIASDPNVHRALLRALSGR